ncbi:MAG: FKBP-type peptidyl-prolyl cis-trans isomerase [Pseudomonadales bacterium]
MSDRVEVRKDRVVRFHYQIQDDAGATVESNRDGEPMAVLIGRGNLLRALEEALSGHITGDRFQVTLAPEQAYGPCRDDMSKRVSKKYLANAARLRPGMTTQLSTEEGPRPVTVIKVGSKVVDVDLNHPQAGKTLTFDLEIVDVRDATAEEIAHRHVHGPGGHAH